MGWFWTSAFSAHANRQYKNGLKKMLEINEKNKAKSKKKNASNLGLPSMRWKRWFLLIFDVLWGAKMEPQTLPKSIPKWGWSLRTLQGPILTPFRDHFETIWRAFGDHLDHLGTILGAFGTIWDHVGTMLGALEAVWEQFRSTSDQNSSYNGTTR